MTRYPLIALCLMLLAGCAKTPPAESSGLAANATPRTVGVRTIDVDLPSGKTTVDLYCYNGDADWRRPLVVVAHGFSRSRKNMAGWGRELAADGYLVAVPDLPAWSDHARNGRFINELVGHLAERQTPAVDPDMVGLVGFSAGGLSTLLATADNANVKVWVGLDPVDRNGMGRVAAARLKCNVGIFRAEPSSCNANGNAIDIQRALTVPCTSVMIQHATHADPEWPTDRLAELVCGAASDERRALFVRYARDSLRDGFYNRPSHRP